MNDLLDLAALLVVIVMLVLLVAPPPGGIVHWLLQEWRLMRAKSWESDYLVNPALGSITDSRVARMVLKQRTYGKRLRRQGRTLLARKPYVPVLTKTENVIPIRQRNNHP